ncbi:hypothetical protein [Bacteroides fragilis]|uniref:hypothetical protein n=1 Tax=Bacteroides fragilis TaxID=817 RepID=UPI001C6FE4D8|nr:hypothetical protein [Bacteroides fragilis]
MGILQPIPDLNLSLRSELYGIDNQNPSRIADKDDQARRRLKLIEFRNNTSSLVLSVWADSRE